MQKKVSVLLVISVVVSVLIITTAMNMNPLFPLDPVAKAERIALADSNVRNLIDGENYTIELNGWGSNPKVNPFISYPELTILLANNTHIEVIVDLVNNKVIKVDKSIPVYSSPFVYNTNPKITH